MIAQTHTTDTKPLFYQELLQERAEIHKHKWVLSEKEGREVGFERALTSWVLHHRSDWLKARRALRSA